MNKYKIYVRNREKPIKVIASEWITDGDSYVFLLKGAEVFRMNSNDLIGMKKEVINE